MDLPKKGQKVISFEDVVTVIYQPNKSEMIDERK